MSKKKRKAVGCRGYTMEEFIEVAREKFGETISYDKTVYKNVKSDIVVTCKNHGDFKTKPEYFLRSPTGCLKCGKSVNLEEFVLRSLKRHGDKYSYDKVVYKNTSTPVEITCTKHGSFWCEPYSHYRKGSGCPMCARERGRLTTADFVARSKKAHREKYDYSRTIYKTEKDTVETICPEQGLLS